MDQNKFKLGGGVFIAMDTITGVVIGSVVFHQPIIGMLIGFAFGTLTAAAIWLYQLGRGDGR